MPHGRFTFTYLFLDQQVVVLRGVVEDDVCLAVAGPADVRAEHDGVSGVATEAVLVNISVKELDVCPSAI